MITVVRVKGSPELDQFGARKADKKWTGAQVDGNHLSDLRVTIRYWATEGHPFTVYLDGSVPLYPTVVYDEHGNLLAFDPGKTGLER